MGKLISIDPGVNYFAWAVFEDGQFQASGTMKRESPQAMLFSWRGILNIYKPGLVVVEGQQVYGGDEKSWASAVKGDLIRLAHCTGMLVACQEDGMWEIVDPRVWKGNLTKEVVKKRVKHVTGLDFKGHENDAVGLGLWKLGKLLPVRSGEEPGPRRRRGRGRARKGNVRGGSTGSE